MWPTTISHRIDVNSPLYGLSSEQLDDARVAEILVQVNTTRRESDIKLEEKDWGQARQTNKRKKLLLEGKDPEAEENESGEDGLRRAAEVFVAGSGQGSVQDM